MESYGIKTDGSKPYIAVWDGGRLICRGTDTSGSTLYVEDSFSGIRVKAVSGSGTSTICLQEESLSREETGCQLAVYDKYTKRAAGWFGYDLREVIEEE